MNRSFAIASLLVVVALAFGLAQLPAAEVPSKPSAAPAAAKPEAKAAVAPSDPSKERPVTYKVRQIVRLDQIKAGAKNVRMWVSIPDDEQNQRVLDMNVVSAPGKWSIVRDLENRASFLKVEVNEPKAAELDVEVEFVVTRKPVYLEIDPKQAGPLNETLKKVFAPHLALKAPHMEVTAKVLDIADTVCKDETNLATQASLLMDHVAKFADHYSYSKDPLMPKCGIGDATVCLTQKGGCCTDLHSLFIALARARGIPTRLAMGYRLQEKNLDKLVDPGYRCWVEYFIPNYGWISADIVEADAPGGMGAVRWSKGLTARRLWLNSGREFKLAEDQKEARVNHMSIAYAEIDGVPARLLPEGTLQPQITRKVQFTEIASPAVAAASANR